MGCAFFVYADFFLSGGYRPNRVSRGIEMCIRDSNIRDIDEDREHGKHTLAVRLGESGARTLLIVCCVIAWIIALLMCGTLWWPWGAVLLLSGTGIPVRMVSSVNKRQFRPALPAAKMCIRDRYK